ncbi:MAG: pentapeptide repeat-containing protein [Planctomycetota bacterium]
MVQINFARKEVLLKIVYYGCGLAGKTTCLEVVYEKSPQDRRGELTSIATEGDRTLFFDFFSLTSGTVAGMNTRFRLYTVPGQVYYNSTRKLVLQGVDGVVFVADSQTAKLEENKESLANLKENLKEYHLNIETLPLVFQYNKRDLPNILTVNQLNQELNFLNAPFFESVAFQGEGIFKTLETLCSKVLQSVSGQFASASSSSLVSTSPTSVSVSQSFPETLPSELKEYTSEEALQLLLEGKPLQNAKVCLLNLNHQIFEQPIHLQNMNIDCLQAHQTIFKKPFHWNNGSLGSLECGELGENVNENAPEKEHLVVETLKAVTKIPAQFESEFSLKNLVVSQSIDFSGVHFQGEVSFQNISFPKNQNISFYKAHFQKSFKIYDCQLGGIDWRNVLYVDLLEIINTTFQGHVNAWNGVFSGNVKIRNTIFQDKARFRAALFEKPTAIIDTKFYKEGFFGEAMFQQETSFYSCEFQGEAHFHLTLFAGETHFSKTRIKGATLFNQVRWKGKLNAREAEWTHLQMERSVCEDEVDFSQLNCSRIDLKFCAFKDIVYFQNAIFHKLCDFTGSRFEQKCSFKGAQFLGKVVLSEIDAKNIVLEWNQIQNKLLSEQQKDFILAANEYGTLKTIFEQQNRYEDMDEAYFCFKQAHRKTLKISISHPLQTLNSCCSYFILDLGCGYGTRPLRITMSSLVIIFFFGFLYSLFPNGFVYLAPSTTPISFDWSNAIYFSIATFTTMGFGDWAPHHAGMIRFIVTMEAFVGIFTMSLFVAVFTRKIIR